MNAQRIMIINSAIFVLILAVSVFMITQERTLPGEPPVEELQQEVAKVLSQRASEGTGKVESNLVNLPQRNVFETLIPLPTPTPLPPKPTPAPVIVDEATEFWRLSGPLSRMAAFQDIKTREDFSLKIGEYREEKVKGESFKIFLESTVPFKSATVRMEDDGHVTRRTFTMN